jgi:hypothetical protein
VENWAFAVPADGGVAGPWFREFDRAVRLGLNSSPASSAAGRYQVTGRRLS